MEWSKTLVALLAASQLLVLCHGVVCPRNCKTFDKSLTGTFTALTATSFDACLSAAASKGIPTITFNKTSNLCQGFKTCLKIVKSTGTIIGNVAVCSAAVSPSPPKGKAKKPPPPPNGTLKSPPPPKGTLKTPPPPLETPTSPPPPKKSLKSPPPPKKGTKSPKRPPPPKASKSPPPSSSPPPSPPPPKAAVSSPPPKATVSPPPAKGTASPPPPKGSMSPPPPALKKPPPPKAPKKPPPPSPPPPKTYCSAYQRSDKCPWPLRLSVFNGKNRCCCPPWKPYPLFQGGTFVGCKN